MAELQASAAADRLLGEGPAERGRTFLPSVLALIGGAGRARVSGGPALQRGLTDLGRATEPLSRKRVAGGGWQNTAAVHEPLARAATATPLMRCSDPSVVTTTEQLLNALPNVEDTVRIEAFGRVVNAPTAPRLSSPPSCHAHAPAPARNTEDVFERIWHDSRHQA
ncbi:hypothetical protein [Streptomyces mayonensis]|uniref:hypothetical protein n=1 Tax=Streptomyces mayonensis TaxID=2750816 RepID=UPI001C1E41B5|nr:hypothetical protein [Streptomyces sp. A108]MBU6532167.1 hypothetical protein [Streptomyces sp. A108]